MDGNRQATGHSSGQFRPDNIDGDVDKYFCPGVGVGLTHTENLMIKKLKEVRETSELELEEEELEPTIGRNFKRNLKYPMSTRKTS